MVIYMKKETLWITRTALMVALLIAVQFATRSLGQLVTGSCVNLILAVAVLACGYKSGITVALLSPFFAFLLGIGPALIAIVPAISVGNAVFVTVLYFASKKLGPKAGPLVGIWAFLSVVAAAAAKFLALFLLVTRLILPMLGLPEAKAAAMTAMFSWPQLVTAFIGGVAAVLIVPLLHLKKTD